MDMQSDLSTGATTPAFALQAPRPSDPCPRLSALVTVEYGIQALVAHATEIDLLNRASRRPNAFLSAAFLQCYARYSEYSTPDRDVRLYLVRDHDGLIGCVPMRISTDDFGTVIARSKLRIARLGFLATADIEQPGILCAPDDEPRVATALIQHLQEVDRDWGMLEFAGQRPHGALHRAAHAAADHRFRTRDIHVEPFNEITVVWPDLTSYFRSLEKKMRSNISRQARRLFAAGEPELVLANGVAAAAWFDAYCELDSRSWKHGTASSIRRQPRRVAFYREILAGRGGLEPSFIGILLNGELIAGLIAGHNTGEQAERSGTWCLEMAYDNARASLGPAQLLLLLSVGDAVKRGNRFVNFLQNFAYYKHRWKADPISVVNVQVLRRLSLHDLRGSLGELKRKLRPSQSAAAANSEAGTTDDTKVEADAVPVGGRPSHALAEIALASGGLDLIRLNRSQTREYLPFKVD